jgi:predicted permease
MEWFGELLKQVLRRLRRAPMFTAVTLLTLAAGIGANTAVFSVVEGVLLKPLPYPHADELVGIWHRSPSISIGDISMAPSCYFIYREQGHAFQDIGLFRHDSVSVTGVSEPEQVPAIDVTEGTLRILGVPPLLGRWFSHAEDSPGSTDTAMLAYGYWRRKFGADPTVLGRSITVNGKTRQIIGVMPQQFHFLDWEDPALIFPEKLDRNNTKLGQFSYEAVARLKPGVTLEAASADVARLIPIVWRSFPAPQGFSVELFEKAQLGPAIRPLKKDVVGDVGKLLWVLMGSIGLVLLIACANVANLLLVRTEGRQQEIALRSALGASRGRIAGELLFESVVIGILGSLFGLGLAYGALRLLVRMAPAGLPRLNEIGIDLPVLIFTLTVSLLAGLLFGAIPVLNYASARLGTGLREGGRSLSQSRERHRARNILVAVQVGLALVLILCSGLMMRTFYALTQVNAGFTAPADVQTFRLTIPSAEVVDEEKVVRMQEAILHKLEAIPGVSSAALSISVPIQGNHWSDPVFAEDRQYAQGELPPLRRFKFVSPGLIHTLGMRLVAGRDFTWADNYNRLPVAIISENFAREYWQSPANALGKRIRVASTDDWREIVGVAGDVHDDGMNLDAPTIAYWPILMNRFEGDAVEVHRSMAFILRTPRAGSQSLMQEVQQAVWSVDPNLPLASARTLDYYYNRSMARTSFTLVMLGIAAGMALLLGTVGLYGVIAYSVSQRTREIGIRLALGAQQKELIGMFVRQGLVVTGAGAAGGLLVALASTRLMSSLLFHVSPADPLTYALASAALVGAAALASYIPSRRASTIDPVEALRAE